MSDAPQDPTPGPFFTLSRDLLCLAGRDGRPRQVNPAFTRVLGWSEGELRSRPFPDLVHPDDRADAEAQWASVLAGAAPPPFETRCVCADGTSRRISWQLSGPDERGLILAAGRDVTARHEAESRSRLLAQHQSEANFRATFEQAAVGMGHVAEDARIIRVNERLCTMLGYTREELLGRSFADLTHPDDVPAVLAKVGEILRGTIATFTIEKRLLRRDGTPLPVHETVSLTRDTAGGAPRYFLAVLEDISERAAAAAVLRASEERYRLATRATNDVVYEWDLTGNTVHWSAALETELGHAPDSLRTTLAWWEALLHDEDREPLLADLRAALASRADTWSAEYRMRRGDGTFAHVLERGYIVRRDDTGEPVRMIGAISDQSRRRELEAQLRQAQKMEAVGQLAGGVAHDFNNLLTVIKMHVELGLEELRPDHPLYADLEEVRRATNRAAALTRQLLAFSRRQVLQPQRLDVNVLIADLQRMLARLIGEDIEMSLDLDEGVGPVLADPGQLEQVLVNLAINARDAMPRGGALGITTRAVELSAAEAAGHAEAAAGRYVAIAMRDSGDGMPPDVQARIFEPFFTTKEVGRGTGLGLATVYGIVIQSGGFIEVRSAPGHGAVFTVYLPTADTPAPAAAELPPAPEAPRVGGRETVLVVEDEEAVRSIARRVLVQHGYTVLEARHGAEALAIASAPGTAIDLVLSDAVMPQMSGPDLARALEARRPGLPVLFMSGYTDEDLVRRGAVGVGAALLHKPFTAERLLRAVRATLERGAVSAERGARARP